MPNSRGVADIPTERESGSNPARPRVLRVIATAAAADRFPPGAFNSVQVDAAASRSVHAALGTRPSLFTPADKGGGTGLMEPG